jgi:hypothetical protein
MLNIDFMEYDDNAESNPWLTERIGSYRSIKHFVIIGFCEFGMRIPYQVFIFDANVETE